MIMLVRCGYRENNAWRIRYHRDIDIERAVEVLEDGVHAAADVLLGGERREVRRCSSALDTEEGALCELGSRAEEARDEVQIRLAVRVLEVRGEPPPRRLRRDPVGDLVRSLDGYALFRRLGDPTRSGSAYRAGRPRYGTREQPGCYSDLFR